MDRITPIELEKTQLPRKMRGYDIKIVDNLLERSSHEIEGLLTEQRQLRSDNDRLLAEAQKHREMESSIRDAILIAQKAADETRMNAHKEADLIIESAKQKAFEEQHELAKEVDTLLNEIEALKRERDRFIRQFRTLLNDHLKELGQLDPNVNTAAVVVVEEETPVEVKDETTEEVVATE
jgi:cell division initiation protein